MSAESHPLTSLAAMRERHLLLLEAQPEPGTSNISGFLPQVQEFLREGAALGERIGPARERAEAQGILNYWAATFGAAHSAETRVASAELESRNSTDLGSFGAGGFVVLAPFNKETDEARLAESLNRLESATPEQRAEIEKLLPFLARMEGSSGDLQLVTLAENDPNLGTDGTDSPGTALLKDAGILVPVSSKDGIQQYALASESLFTKWPQLKDYRDLRKSFRERAQVWNRSGKKPTDLLRGEPLQRAELYPDPNLVEIEFRKASKEAVEAENAQITKEEARLAEKKKRNRTIKLGILLLTLGLCFLAYRKAKEVETNRKQALRDAVAQALLVEANERAKEEEKLRKQVEAALEQAEAALKIEQRTKDVLLEDRATEAAAEEARRLDSEKMQHEELDALNKTIEELRKRIDSSKLAVDDLKKLKERFGQKLNKEQDELLTAALKRVGEGIDSAEELKAAAQTKVKESTDASQQTSGTPPEHAGQRYPVLIKMLEGHKLPITSVDFAADGRLATAGEDNLVRLWDRKGNLIKEITGSSRDGVNCVKFSADGRFLAIGSNGSTVRIHNLETGVSGAYEGHSDSITGVSFTTDGSNGLKVLSSSGDQSVQIWDVERKKSEFDSGPLGSIVTSAAFDSDGKQFVASLDGPANAAYYWKDWQPGSKPLHLKMGSPVKRAVFSPSGKLIAAAGSGDNIAAVWDPATSTDKPAFTLTGHTAAVYQAIFDHAGERMATASADQTVGLWSPPLPEQKLFLKGHTGEVRHIAFSPDDQVLLSGSSDATAKLWFKGEESARYTLSGHTRRITAIAFSPDGNLIATGSFDGKVGLWNFSVAP